MKIIDMNLLNHFVEDATVCLDAHQLIIVRLLNESKPIERLRWGENVVLLDR